MPSSLPTFTPGHFPLGPHSRGGPGTLRRGYVLFLVLLMTCGLLGQALAQPLVVQEKRTSSTVWPDFVFPVFQSQAHPEAVQRINTYLQLNELELLIGTEKRDPFEVVRDPDPDAFGGNQSMAFEVLVNDGERLVVVIRRSYNAAYPIDYVSSYLFNVRTGELVTVRDLFSDKGLERLKTRVKKERGRMLDGVKQEAEPELLELLQGVEASAGVLDFSWSAGGLVFHDATHFPPAVRSWDQDLSVALPLEALRADLSDFGKAFFDQGTSLIGRTWQDKLLTGTVGSSPVFMVLMGDETGVMGSYCYGRMGRAIELRGQQKGATLELEEGPYGASTGRINATIQGRTLVGTWRTPDGSKSLSFKVQ